MYRDMQPGCVVLEDGTVYSGFGFATQGRAIGEIVFNTSMTGYQEILTDPSYHGQLITFTYPMIGNYGTSDNLQESGSVHSRAVIVREIKNTAWNRTCPKACIDWLADRSIVGVGGIDTRALTRHIRDRGAMRACVAAGPDLRPEEMLSETRSHPPMAGSDLASAVTCAQPYEWDGATTAGGAPTPGGTSADAAASPDRRFRVVAYDYGVKRSILKCLAAAGCEVTVVPASWAADEVLALRPAGVFLSNGPGDPAAVGYAVETIRGLLGRVPIFGICLGHQLAALALGISTYKLKFGHRGANHPVRNYLTGQVEITSQNHGFAVEPPPSVQRAIAKGAVIGEDGVADLKPEELMLDSEFGRVQVTHLNLNDGTVEGLKLLDAPLFTVQYHPEAAPGPHDSRYLFGQFVNLMRMEKT
jgi:carbamoyl-phosphate synthase small subunit